MTTPHAVPLSLIATAIFATFPVLASATDAEQARPPTTPTQPDPSQGPPQNTSGTRSEDDIFSLDKLIVTGTSQAQTQFDASFATTLLTAEQIDQVAATNFSELMGTMPGIYAESTGGEVQNVYYIRGIPDPGTFVVIQEDGMSPYPENNGYYFKTEGLIRNDLMTESVEAVRGGPSPVFASNAAAIVNSTTRKGGDKPEAAIRTTVGDTDLYRLDGYWSGPVAKDTYLAVGGFYRTNRGYRNVDFTADQGGQLRANLTHKFDQGQLTVSLKHLDEKNAFYMPIPLYDPRDRTTSLDPLIDRFTGTLSTRQLRHAQVRWGDTSGETYLADRDLEDGRHIKYDNIGISFDRYFDNGWSLSNKFSANTLEMTFDALYSSTDPTTADAYAATRQSAARSAYGKNIRLGYAYVDDGSTFDPASTNGLVVQGQYRAMDVDASAVANDLRLTRIFDWGSDRHDVTLGLYSAYYERKYLYRYQNYLLEARENPRLLELVAYDPEGNVAGRVTDGGVISYASSAGLNSSHVGMFAPYVADNWQVTDKLRLEAGVRHERYYFSSWGAKTSKGKIPLDGTLAGNDARLFNGELTRNDVNVDTTNWTLGFNYDVNAEVGVYGRVARAHRMPSEGVAGDDVSISRADQFELGAKLDFQDLDIFATAFYTKYEPYTIGMNGVDPVTGASVKKEYVGSVVNPGVEIAAVYLPYQWLRLDANVTYNRTEVTSLTETDENGEAIVIDVDGNTPPRQPKLYGNVSSTFKWRAGDYRWKFNVRYNYVGTRYADASNTTVLPSYGTLNVGLSVSRGAWDMKLSVNNLTNQFGLSEGNPRTDLIAGQGGSDAIYGRPIYERNSSLAFTWHFD